MVTGQTGELEVAGYPSIELRNDVRFESKADMGRPLIDVRFTPKNDIAKQRQTDRLLRALVSFMLAFAMVALYYVVRHS